MPDKSWYPDVIASDARLSALADLSARLETLPVEKAITHLVDAVDEQLLPQLAHGWHVADLDGWRLADTPEKRRALLRRAIALHRKKGTPWAVKTAIEAAGFGAHSRLVEGRTMRRYDGSLYADGAEIYGGHSWAEYQIEADLCETGGLDPAIAESVAKLVKEWAPVSRHLTRLTWRAEVSERVACNDAPHAAATWTGSSMRPWRRLYDGAHRYDQGVLLTYDGTTKADGGRRYQGWAANDGHWRAGAPESDTTLALAWADADRQQHLPHYDGATKADGMTDYGYAAPVADDLPMPITVTRRVRFDGRYHYGADNRFDGGHRYDGARHYMAGRVASGDETTYLEAA